MNVTYSHALAARLRVFPRHRDFLAWPVVVAIDGVPHIVGNARTMFGAVTLARCYAPAATTAKHFALDVDGETSRKFYFVN